jgi:hypothetical protein
VVVTSIPIPSSLFPNLHSLHPSLLFQFLLSEFLKAYDTTQEVEAVLNRFQGEKDREKSFSTQDRTDILLGITDLIGQIVSFAPTFPWTIRQGNLKALVHYSHLLQKKQQSAPLVETSERAYRQAALSRQHLLTWQEKGSLPPVHKKALIRAIDSMIRNMHKFGNHLTKEITNHSHNENVIFFLLHHNLEFDTLFHAPYVMGLLDKMYRGGIDQAEQHLIRQYTKRGFENLLPRVIQTFANVRTQSTK